MKILSYFCAFAMIATAGCATKKPTAGQVSQFKIADVRASMAPNVGARTDIASKVSRQGRNLAARYNSRNTTAKSAKTIDIEINSVRYKSAVASALVGGSGNMIAGMAYVGNKSGNRGPGMPIQYWDRASTAANGILGIAVAIAGATGGKDRVDDRLARGLAESAIEAAYTNRTPRQFGVAPSEGLSYRVRPGDKQISYTLDRPTSRKRLPAARQGIQAPVAGPARSPVKRRQGLPTPPPAGATF